MDPTPVRHTRSFDNGLKKLGRKYPTVFDAVDLLILELSEGQRPGTLYRRVGATVFRVRLVNRFARSGKSGGFRVAYHVSDAGTVSLIAICARSECRELHETNVRRLISNLQLQ